jgi:hypothetical protein
LTQRREHVVDRPHPFETRRFTTFGIEENRRGKCLHSKLIRPKLGIRSFRDVDAQRHDRERMKKDSRIGPNAAIHRQRARRPIGPDINDERKSIPSRMRLRVSRIGFPRPHAAGRSWSASVFGMGRGQTLVGSGCNRKSDDRNRSRFRWDTRRHRDEPQGCQDDSIRK